MIRALLALLVFLGSTAAEYGYQLRYFSSWSEVCFQNGPGWEITLAELLTRASWNWGALSANSAPYLPYLFFAVVPSFGGKHRQSAMIFAMLCTVAVMAFLSGPVTADDCRMEGPYPEIGQLLFGVFVSLPLALGLAWLTRRKPAKA